MSRIIFRSGPPFTELAQHNTSCTLNGCFSLAEIRETVNGSCGLCTLFSEALHKCAPPHILSSDVKYNVEQKSGDESNSTMIRIDRPRNASIMIEIFADGACTRNHAVPGDGIGALFAANTSSTRSLEYAEKWLQDCADEHERCGSGLPAPLPTRILDVSDSTVRLVHCRGEIAKYACLSHCWGVRSMLKTTTSNVADFGQEIAWDLLPTTFQDAISFTRRLGLKYLWIDSLCIIQDDQSKPTDWECESSMMASTYENSYVTLAASASRDSSEGCYTRGEDLYKPRYLEALEDVSSDDTRVFACLAIPHIAWSHYHTNELFPLMQRAWGYQERMLSPRTIHFAGPELQWECGQVNRCECGTSNHDGIGYGETTQARSEVDKILYIHHMLSSTAGLHAGSSQGKYPQQDEFFKDSTSGAMKESAPNSEYYKQVSKWDSSKWNEPTVVSDSSAISWRRMMRRYAQLYLTFPHDIFPALSGLATSWKSHKPDTYLAGLWKSSLIHDLLWYMIRPRPRLQDWRAPSWSWASVNSPDYQQRYNHFSLQGVENTRNYVAEGTKIIDAQCRPFGPDPTGRLSEGYVVLQCKALSATLWRWQVAGPIPEHSTNYTSTEDFRLSIAGNLIAPPDFAPDTSFSDPASGSYLENGAEVQVLALAVTKWCESRVYSETTETAPIADSPIYCIVVCRRRDSQEYERIGYVCLHHISISDQSLLSDDERDFQTPPSTWKQPKIPRQEQRQKGIDVDFELWKYEAHCKLAKKMDESGVQMFKIV